MKILSTDEPSTLETYRKIAMILGGEDSEAVRFFDKKIAESPNGPAEEVLADESQMVVLIVSMITRNSG
jgi:hypothetical protein